MEKHNLHKRNILAWISGVILLLGLFWLYSSSMQKYVGACDFYGYYQEALLLKSGKVVMDTGLDPKKYLCAAPLGYYNREGRVVPQYTPGYPLLLALGDFLGAGFYVNPLIGVLSVAMMFLLLAQLTEKRIAAIFSVLWAFSPAVVWASTYMMSDTAAALFIMWGYYLFTREKPGAAAIVLGYSAAIRPTNLLFFLVLLPLLIKKRQWLRFGLHLLIPGTLYGAFNWIVYGAPWRFGYGNISFDLTHTLFFPHLTFYLKEIVIQLTPLLVIPALIALVKRTGNSWFYVTWFLVFLIFYCFWRAGGDVWWWTRFLLPSFPALFILGAFGLKEISDAAEQKGKKIRLFQRRFVTAALILVTVAAAIYLYQYGKKRNIYDTNKGYDYFLVSTTAGKSVPPGSLVGGFELSGTLRLYGGVKSFNWHNYDAVDLIQDTLMKDLPVYIVVERWNLEHYFVKRIFEEFRYETVKDTGLGDSWLVEKDKWLFKITGPISPE